MVSRIAKQFHGEQQFFHGGALVRVRWREHSADVRRSLGTACTGSCRVVAKYVRKSRTLSCAADARSSELLTDHFRSRCSFRLSFFGVCLLIKDLISARRVSF
jgi:hypothetical protein